MRSMTTLFGVFQSSLLSFLLHINYLHRDILQYLRNIYTEDTFKNTDDKTLAANLSLLTYPRCVNWFVKLNMTTSKLVWLTPHRADHEDSPLIVDGFFLECLLVLNFYWDSSSPQTSRGSTYIRSVSKNTGNMIGSLYRSSKSLTIPCLLCLYQSQIRAKMHYWCHIWAVDDQSLFVWLDRVQKDLHIIVGNELFL